MRSAPKEFIEIQRLRGIAVLMVVYAHMDFIHMASGISPYFWNSAAAGVDIFFVISGFVVGKTLFEHLALHAELPFLKRLETNVAALKAFFVRRLFRLYPAVLLLIALNVMLLKLFHIVPPPFADNVREEFMGLLSYLSMQTDMDIITNGTAFRSTNLLWTLAVEERFYLIMPFVILAWAATGRFMKFAVAVIVALTLAKILLPIPEPVLHYNGFLRFDSFMMGICVYLIYEHSEVFQRCFVKQYRGKAKIIANLPALLILLIAARLSVCQLITGWGSFTGNGYYYLCINVLASILMVLAIQDKGYVLEIPGLRRALEWAGDRSYTIYVFQYFYAAVAGSLLQHYGLAELHFKMHTAVYFVMLAGGTELIYRFWETPFRMYGKKIAHRIKEEQTAVVP